MIKIKINDKIRNQYIYISVIYKYIIIEQFEYDITVFYHNLYRFYEVLFFILLLYILHLIFTHYL